MVKKIFKYIVFLCFPLFIYAKDEILIISHHCAQPFFVELQAKTFKKFIQDDYKFVVFNDAKTSQLENEITELCNRLDIQCIRIPQAIHQKPYLFREPGEDYQHACVRCANVVQYSLDTLGFDFPGIVVIIDSDMFPIQPISFSQLMEGCDLIGVPQSRGEHVKYIWNGFVVFNMKTLPDRHSINFNCGRIHDVGVDVGGYTHYYLSQHLQEIRTKFISTEFFSDTVQAYQNGTLSKRREHLIPLIETTSTGNMETLLNGAILHYRGGGLWDIKPPEYYERKNRCLQQYIEFLLNNVKD